MIDVRIVVTCWCGKVLPWKVHEGNSWDNGNILDLDLNGGFVVYTYTSIYTVVQLRFVFLLYIGYTLKK